MNNNKICVFDFETDGSDPTCCSPVQLAAVMVDSVKLEVIKGSEFNINLKPEKLASVTKATVDDNPYLDSDILEWHAKVKGVDKSDILNSWLDYPDQKHSWNQFINYLDGYHLVSAKGKKTKFTAPIASGYNINRFDMKIIDRLCKKYDSYDNKENSNTIFHPRDQIDIMNIVYLWFKYIPSIKSISLDSIRSYMGIDATNAHDALKDVNDCAQILIRFLKLHQNFAQKIQFKDAFAKQ
jgi:DNA polymerase III epsilon subunit-like protein